MVASDGVFCSRRSYIEYGGDTLIRLLMDAVRWTALYDETAVGSSVCGRSHMDAGTGGGGANRVGTAAKSPVGSRNATTLLLLRTRYTDVWFTSSGGRLPRLTYALPTLTVGPVDTYPVSGWSRTMNPSARWNAYSRSMLAATTSRSVTAT